ncbi:MAG: DNA polymerase I [candidate division Zixibacteria bacterium]|nr:DNA polymerase I [candidate division Zixibacteria bacterium]
MSAKKNRLYLIDGYALIYRAYFAFIRNPLFNSKGENTSAIFGFVNSLLKIIRDEQPDYIAVVLDTKKPTFRHEKYAEYKSTRAKMPDDLVTQIPKIRQAIEAFRIPIIEKDGFEADDIIGTFAIKAAKQGCQVWCVTGDKDFFQLVGDNIGILYPGKKAGIYNKMGPEEVKEKFGVYPERVIDKLALMGDSSDNIPGVPGIGPKTADSLLAQFDTLEDILGSYEQITAKGVREKIANNIESARLSKELVTIHLEVPVPFELEKLKKQEPDKIAAGKLFKELEFNRLAREFMPEAEAEQKEATKSKKQKLNYIQITNIEELKELIKKLRTCKEVAVDTETTSLNTREAVLVGVSLSSAAGTAYYIPIAHEDKTQNLPYDQTIAELRKLLEDKKVQKFGQNLKYDLEIFHENSLNIDPISFDTMIASYLTDSLSREHSLTFLARKYFDYQMQPITDLIGSGKSQKSFATVPVKDAVFYAAEDADYTFRLRGKLAPLIEQNEMHNLYYNIELPLVRILADMEETGIRVDPHFLGELSKEAETELGKSTKSIYKIAGGEFNINSTQQLSHILFDKLGLPTKGRTAKKTSYSTDVRVLEELAELHELPKLILDYRQLTKLKNTYIDALPRLISEKTGRVHTSFNQTIAATGRLSSTNPNLQNIPVRTEEGRKIRKAFIPRDKDHVLLIADYSQIELRLLAHYSGDKVLVKAFVNSEDIHTRTAAEVYNVAIDKVTPDMRRSAKTANFAIIYGVSAYGLSQQSELNLEQSKEFIEMYFKRYSGIRKYMDETISFAKEKGYVTTMFNRRRLIPQINDKNYVVRQSAERVAINTPLQGTAAEIIKIAMIKIYKKMAGMKSKMVLQVHDELIFDTHKDELEALQPLVKTEMEKAVKLKVPVVVDTGFGNNWLDAK